MNEYFNWSKVYSVTHTQGSYLIFTIECDKKSYAGVMLPACMDDIWYMAGSRLMEKVNNQDTVGSPEEVLEALNDWMTTNLKGQFSIEPVENMYPPIEMEMGAEA